MLMWFPYPNNRLLVNWNTCSHWLELRYLGSRHKRNGHRLCAINDFNLHDSEAKAIKSLNHKVTASFQSPDGLLGSPRNGFHMCVKRELIWYVSAY